MRPIRPATRLGLPAVVLSLGLVSLLTDLSSEMILPLLPLFVAQVLGGGALALGVIEGAAEATAALLKVVSGRLTDATGRRRPLVIGGYSLSGLARPAIAFAGGWPFVLACRFMDRVGKGLRTAPRDALIADWTPPERRGAAFGLHRSLDHLGAVLGPLAAAGLLASGVSLRGVFLWAAAPAALVVLVLIRGVREADGARAADFRAAAPDPPAPRRWPWLLSAAFVGAVGAPADAFLLLLLSEARLAPALVAALWSAHNVIRLVSAFGGGLLADRWPRLSLIVIGWIGRAAALLALGWWSGSDAVIAAFLCHAGASGVVEPAERALVADLAQQRRRGRAFGLYHGAVGLGALPAGALYGALWDVRGPALVFSLAGGLVAVGAGLALAGVRRPLQRPTPLPLSGPPER